MPQPKHFLIQILFKDPKTPIVTSFYDNKPIDPKKPFRVNVGDLVAWVVQIAMKDGSRIYPPYEVIFDAKDHGHALFGVGTLAVPAGDTSPFLEVKKLKGKVTYSLNVTGIGCVFDPVIQSGEDSSEGGIVATDINASKFKVTWDTTTNSITYTKNAVAGLPPLNVQAEDTVEFVAKIPALATASGFTVTFDGLNWASPFDPDQTTFVANSGDPVSIGPKKVGYPTSTPTPFPFKLAVTVGAQDKVVSSELTVIP